MCFARHASVRARSRRTERPRSFRHHHCAGNVVWKLNLATRSFRKTLLQVFCTTCLCGGPISAHRAPQKLSTPPLCRKFRVEAKSGNEKLQKDVLEVFCTTCLCEGPISAHRAPQKLSTPPLCRKFRVEAKSGNEKPPNEIDKFKKSGRPDSSLRALFEEVSDSILCFNIY